MDLSKKQRLFACEYRGLFDFVYRYVRYRVPNVADAEDVVSEVFERTYAKLELFDPTVGTLRQWTCGFARHAVADHWRRHRATVSLDDLAETLPSPASLTPADELDHRLGVERAIRALSPEIKALLAMRYEDDMTHAEIADATGKDPAAVRKFFSRLLASLRLSHEDNPYDE
jgi:RNA polymerase sigma-70 factor (ECF subfamily)